MTLQPVERGDDAVPPGHLLLQIHRTPEQRTEVAPEYADELVVLLGARRHHPQVILLLASRSILYSVFRLVFFDFFRVVAVAGVWRRLHVVLDFEDGAARHQVRQRTQVGRQISDGLRVADVRQSALPLLNEHGRLELRRLGPEFGEGVGQVRPLLSRILGRRCWRPVVLVNRSQEIFELLVVELFLVPFPLDGLPEVILGRRHLWEVGCELGLVGDQPLDGHGEGLRLLCDDLVTIVPRQEETVMRRHAFPEVRGGLGDRFGDDLGAVAQAIHILGAEKTQLSVDGHSRPALLLAQLLKHLLRQLHLTHTCCPENEAVGHLFRFPLSWSVLADGFVLVVWPRRPEVLDGHGLLLDLADRILAHHTDAQFLEDLPGVLAHGPGEHGQQSRTHLDERDFGHQHQLLREVLAHVVPDEVHELGGRLDACGAATHDDKVKKPLFLLVAHAR
mmetsp:Transcript_38357/g.96083  ORF Transcript_38357/g.96083 Transcript_38357/m.96083 type:complete len:448 (+) Transcript_38357:255-1598(+)